MTHEGPLLESLTRRLAETPADFLAEPRSSKGHGEVVVAAVVGDLLSALGGRGQMTKDLEDRFAYSGPNDKAKRNWLRTVLVSCWLLYDDHFRSSGKYGDAARALIMNDLAELAKMTQAPALVTDPDRREELARICLRALDLRPAGETEAAAQDRLQTLSSVERWRVIQEAKAAEERARKIREAMAKKAAEEAAAAYGRE